MHVCARTKHARTGTRSANRRLCIGSVRQRQCQAYSGLSLSPHKSGRALNAHPARLLLAP
eukprot:2962352-Pleurochrysis_carterae.AAC.2